MRLARAMYELVLQAYEVKFEINVANGKYMAITLSKDGYHVRGNMKTEICSEDQICGSLECIKEQLDLRLKATIIGGKK